MKDAASERDAEVKYTKAAAVVAGSMMALGAAAPAMADDVDNAPAGKDDSQFANLDTVNKSEVNNPLKDADINLEALVGKASDAIKAKQDSDLGTTVGAPGAKAAPAPMLGGLPATGALPIGG
ncbi:hypothetical protein ACFQVC_15380 [Streptomyces monticola]|uniref:ATP-binding protein n=1 Tax=Streptomyces monticola TaxID=2666263 RepID=A0ABW2JHP4_9ACTN